MDRAHRQRLAIIILAVAAVLIVVELVAIALGLLPVALACAGLFVVGWFVVRRIFGAGATTR